MGRARLREPTPWQEGSSPGRPGHFWVPCPRATRPVVAGRRSPSAGTRPSVGLRAPPPLLPAFPVRRPGLLAARGSHVAGKPAFPFFFLNECEFSTCWGTRARFGPETYAGRTPGPSGSPPAGACSREDVSGGPAAAAMCGSDPRACSGLAAGRQPRCRPRFPWCRDERRCAASCSGCPAPLPVGVEHPLSAL